jgi:hypothetical protein
MYLQDSKKMKVPQSSPGRRLELTPGRLGTGPILICCSPRGIEVELDKSIVQIAPGCNQEGMKYVTLLSENQLFDLSRNSRRNILILLNGLRGYIETKH